MSWANNLVLGFTNEALNGPKGRERGREAAREFLASNPTREQRKAHWEISACLRDDYDRGYRDVLSEHLLREKPDGA